MPSVDSFIPMIGLAAFSRLEFALRKRILHGSHLLEDETLNRKPIATDHIYKHNAMVCSLVSRARLILQ